MSESGSGAPPAEASGAAGKRWLIAGLGNPGPEYELTPHNLGFLVVDRLGERHGIRITRPESASLTGVGTMGGGRVILAKPQTFMNLSGPAIKGLLEKYELGAENLLLVYDELALPWMHVRIRPKGSSAGHNGVISVIQSLGSEDFARLRLGVHPGREVGDGAKFLLSPMKRGQWKELDELLDTACQAVESITADGVEKTMAKINRRARGEEMEQE
jgi:PTH1 family peptidyl-tRNA hydrolase